MTTFWVKLKEILLIRLKKWNKNVLVTRKVEGYLNKLTWRRHSPELESAYKAIKSMPNSNYQTPITQIEFLEFLIKTKQSQTILEIGTFKGFTSLCLALASRPTSHVHTCELNEDNIEYAKKLWQDFKVNSTITVHSGPALDSLEGLISRDLKFDFIYIDANKNQYPEYYECALKLSIPGTIIIIDNALWAGLVPEEKTSYSHAQLLNKLNKKVYESSHTACSFIPAWDGALMILV